MLDLKFIQNNPQVVQDSLNSRGMDVDVHYFLKLDEKRRKLIGEVEELRNERNSTSKLVGDLKKQGKDAEEYISRLSEISEKLKTLDADKKEVEEKLHNLRLSIPNIPYHDVPIGDDEDANIEIKTWGEKPKFAFTPKPHWELGTELGGLDFPRASKIAGSRFALYWNWAAKLERVLINYMLEIQTTEHGYTEVLPPFIVNSDSMQGTGQLPKFEEDLFKLQDWDYYLIPTAEVPVTNIHKNESLTESDLPLAYTAFTPCFRSEAGSYGKDTKGLMRQHQFNKVELVRFAHPDDSYDQLEILLNHAEPYHYYLL